MIDISINFPISKTVRKNILLLQNELKQVDSNQKIVRELKLHCTVKSCGILGKQINKDNILEIVKTAEQELKKIKPFIIKLKGIGNFSTAVFIRVISDDSKLIKLHNLLNKNIKYSEYPKFEGSGYMPHVTIVELSNPSRKLLAQLDRYKNYDFGSLRVNKLNIILGGDASPQDKFKILKSITLR